MLLASKANVNAHNSFGKTALFYAIQFNNLESVRLLLKAGASVNQQLQNLEEIEKNSFANNLYTEIKLVGSFTPLAYAKK